MEATIVQHWPIVAWIVTVVFLAGQSWANTRALKMRQDDTNAHLLLLNGKTFDSHGEIGSLIGAINALPCRTGQTCEIIKRTGD